MAVKQVTPVIVRCEVGSGLIVSCDLCNSFANKRMWRLTMPQLPAYLYAKLLANTDNIHCDFFYNTRSELVKGETKQYVYVCRKCMKSIVPNVHLMCMIGKFNWCDKCLKE